MALMVNGFNWGNGKFPEFTNPDMSYHGLKYWDVFGNFPRQQIDEDNKIITFERGNLLICLNFHVKNSQLDYPINVSGIKYELILNSDNPKFGCHDILKDIEPYEATVKSKKNIIKTYIPARTGIVLKRIKD